MVRDYNFAIRFIGEYLDIQLTVAEQLAIKHSFKYFETLNLNLKYPSLNKNRPLIEALSSLLVTYGFDLDSLTLKDVQEKNAFYQKFLKNRLDCLLL